MIRLHPTSGGQDIKYARLTFKNVSPDIFISLDKNDPSSAYHITRKFNISLAINPNLWPAKDFFEHFTQGTLQQTKKCSLHGDLETAVNAHPNLMDMLHQKDLVPADKSLPLNFSVNGETYFYDSIGVAANHDYGPVNNRSSHFEIKFRHVGTDGGDVSLCLNIHLTADNYNQNKKPEVCERLMQSIRLFYAQLGVLNQPYYVKTTLQQAMKVNLDNHEQYAFESKHLSSLEALDYYTETSKYMAKSKPEFNISDYINLESAKQIKSGFFKPKAQKINNTALPVDEFPPLPTIKNKVVNRI